jgi:hypothetical protein
MYESIKDAAVNIKDVLFVLKRQGDSYDKTVEEQQVFVFQR